MLRAFVFVMVFGALTVAGIGVVTRPVRQSDVGEVHTLVRPSDLGAIVPVGSTVDLECQLPDGRYLALGPADGITLPIVTVTADELDAAPKGPFTESCDHWKQRHHVINVAS